MQTFLIFKFPCMENFELDIKNHALVAANEIWLCKKSKEERSTFNKCIVSIDAMSQRSHLTKSETW